MAEACTQGVDTGFVALGYAKVAVLGVVQGITELLPISSTAHMRILPAVLGWQDPGSAFSAAMQLAALAAVVSYFWSDVRHLAVSSVAALVRRDFKDQYFRLAGWIVLATIPIGLAGLALAGVLNTCNSPLRSLTVIGFACPRPWLQARRGGSLLLPARVAGDRARRVQGNLGVAQGPPRRPGLVDPGGRIGGRIGLSLCGHLGADAGAGALLGLAIRGLPRRARRAAAGRRGGWLVRLTAPTGYRAIVNNRFQRTAHGQRHTSQAWSPSRTEKKITCARPTRFSNGT